MTKTQTHLEVVSDIDLEVVHIRCEPCNVVPLRAVCGESLEGDDEVAASTLPDCKTCTELWELHKRVLHP